MVHFIRAGLLPLTTIFVVFVVAACSGKSTKPEATTAQASENGAVKPESAPEATAKEGSGDAGAASSKKDNTKERAGTAYKSLHCAGALATPKDAADVYKEHGFKSPKHFMKMWTHYAKKDSDWAHEIANAAEKMDCKK